MSAEASIQDELYKDLIPGEIGCRRLTSEDRDLMVDLTLNHFLPREPICSLTEKKFPGKMGPFLRDVYIKNVIQDNASLIAYDIKSGEAVGIILGNLHRVGEPHPPVLDKDIAPMARLLDAVNVDIASYVGEDVYLTIALSTVKETHCKRGIMTAIRKRIELVAKELNCGYVTSESTSLYTQLITSKLGYDTKKEIKFAEYVDSVTGEYFTKDIDPPHYCVKLMIKKIN